MTNLHLDVNNFRGFEGKFDHRTATGRNDHHLQVLTLHLLFDGDLHRLVKDDELGSISVKRSYKASEENETR